MICSLRSHRNTRQLSRARLSRGFTLLELLIVVGIVIILSALAVPVIQNTMRVYAMRSAISSITGVISSTRYQAIFNGCQSQLVITKANFSYQIQSENPGVGGATCNGAFANVGGLTPFSGQEHRSERRYHLDFQTQRCRRQHSSSESHNTDPIKHCSGLGLVAGKHSGVNLWKHHCHAISRAASAVSLSLRPWLPSSF